MWVLKFFHIIYHKFRLKKSHFWCHSSGCHGDFFSACRRSGRKGGGDNKPCSGLGVSPPVQPTGTIPATQILIGSPWYHDTRPGKPTKKKIENLPMINGKSMENLWKHWFYGKSWNIYPFLMGKSMRNCHIFNSKLLNSQRLITMIILPYTETSIILHLSIIWLLKNPDCSMVESPFNSHSTIMFWWLMHRFSWLAMIWIPYGSV